ncbi:MAG: hypothetical protein LBM93_07875 [Oscillospiraceae bacterium]|nr:hypothetical protein [Oscillospiraceae bacterium]
MKLRKLLTALTVGIMALSALSVVSFAVDDVPAEEGAATSAVVTNGDAPAEDGAPAAEEDGAPAAEEDGAPAAEEGTPVDDGTPAEGDDGSAVVFGSDGTLATEGSPVLISGTLSDEKSVPTGDTSALPLTAALIFGGIAVATVRKYRK